MTEPTEAELAALDLALDGLAQRRQVTGDAAFDALAEFAASIDAQAAELSGDHSAAARRRDARQASVPKGRQRPPGRPSGASRPNLRRRLAALPAILGLAFLIGVPISAFPSTPPYPIHRIIFQDGKLSPADNARLNLVSATQALDQASTGSGTTRDADLKLALAHLERARKQVAMITDATTRAQLNITLSNLEQRARWIDPTQGTFSHGGVGNGPSIQDGNQERWQPGSGDQYGGGQYGGGQSSGGQYGGPGWPGGGPGQWRPR